MKYRVMATLTPRVFARLSYLVVCHGSDNSIEDVQEIEDMEEPIPEPREPRKRAPMSKTRPDQVLEYMKSRPEGMRHRVSDIARHLEISVGTIGNCMRTLKSKKLIEKSPEGGWIVKEQKTND